METTNENPNIPSADPPLSPPPVTDPAPSAADAGADVPPVDAATPVVETRTYTDGSSATGVAPLPDKSPDQQEADERVEPTEPTQAQSVLGEIEAKLHHLELLPSELAAWFKAKLKELKAAL